MPDASDDEATSADEMHGDEPADLFDEIQTELMHARESAERSISEPLNQVTGALDSMQDEDTTDARPDRLEELQRNSPNSSPTPRGRRKRGSRSLSSSSESFSEPSRTRSRRTDQSFRTDASTVLSSPVSATVSNAAVSGFLTV